MYTKLQVFGADRLLFGSDFPFVQQQKDNLFLQKDLENQMKESENNEISTVSDEEPYQCYANIFRYWPMCQETLTSMQWSQLMSETSEKLYGKFS